MHQTYSPLPDGQVTSQNPQLFFSVALHDPASDPAQHEQKSTREDAIIRSQHLYQPPWLTKRVLIPTLLLFSAFWATLVLLWHIISVQNGLVLTLTSNYYAWTYGPTAILTLVLSFWRQIDYHCKVSQPWREMMAGYSTAERSLLLDYISPAQLVSLYKSLRRKHYTVMLSVAGFLLLKLTVLISTVLLLPEQTLHSGLTPITYTTAFNASSFLETIPQNQTIPKNLTAAEDPTYHYLRTNRTKEALWTFVKQLNGQAPDPTQVKDNKVLQAFTTRTSNVNITAITADIDIFVPNVTCEEAKVERRHVGEYFNDFALYLDSQACSSQLAGFFDFFPDTTDTLSRETSFQFFETLVNCSETFSDLRIMVATVNTTNIKSTSPAGYDFADMTTAVLCTIDFSMGKANATLQLNSDSVDSVDLANVRLNAGTPMDLTGQELSAIVHNTLQDGDAHIGADWPAGTVGNNPAIFPLMLKYFKTQDWNTFFDQNTLKQRVTSTIQLLTLQLATSQFLQPASLDGEGYVTVSQQKLHIRQQPLTAMIVCFAILTCVTAVSMLLLRRKVLPQEFGSIASHATLLTSSPALAKVLDGAGYERTSALGSRLNGLRFRALVSEQKYSIGVTPSAKEPHQPKRSSATTKSDNWIPFAARTPMLTLVFTSALVIIGVLEVLQRISDRKNGVIGISESNFDVVYTLRYCSVVIIFSLATLFNNLDFTITAFSAFSALRSATKTAEKTVLANLIGETPMMALYHSLNYRYYWTSLSILSALLGSTLPIVLSGLWKVDNQVMLSTVVTATTDTWNLTWANDDAGDKGAAQMLNIIDYGGATEPTSVWQDSVLPSITKWSYGESNISAGLSNNLASDFDFSLLSLRPELDCIVAPEEAFSHQNVTVIPWHDLAPQYWQYWQEYNASFPIPAGCSPGPSMTSSSIVLNYTSYDPNNSTHQRDDLLGLVYDLDIVQAVGTGNSTQKKECPSLGFVFGYASNLTAILCSQKLVKVPMKVKYKDDPSTNKIDTQQPPTVELPADPELAPDPVTGYATHQYRIAKHLDKNGLMTVNDTFTLDTYTHFSPFFDHLIYGPYQIKRETIMGRENADNLIAVVNMFYNKYMTLVIDMNFRSTAVASATSNPLSNSTSRRRSASTPDPTIIHGTVTLHVSRLRIDKASKLALQIMIATMTLFMAIAVKKAKIRKTLPRNPCNIASVMGFLAGSALCDPERTFIPPGSEFLDKRGMAELFKGRMVRLGWWSSSAVPETRRREASQDVGNEDEDRSLTQNQRFGIDLVLSDDNDA